MTESLNIKDIYKKYKFIIWPIVSAFASIIILFLVVIPQILTYFQDQNKISKLNKESKFLEVKADKLNNLNGEEIKRYIETAFTILPADKNIPDSVNILTEVVRKSSLELKNVSFVNNSKGAAKGSYGLQLTLQGSLQNVRTFLTQLQKTPRIFKVESIGAQFLEGSSTVEVEIPISVFYEEGTNALVSKETIPELSDSEKQFLSELTSLLPKSVTAISAPSSPSGTVVFGKENPFE